MRQKIFAIMGATGHIGHIVVEDLLKRGHIVRAIGRDPKKLHQLELKGAIPIALDMEDARALTDAFQDAYAIFSFIPPSYIEVSYSAYQDSVSHAICTAIEQSGSTRVVNLSSIGAEHVEGTGVINGLGRHEMRLNALNNLEMLIHLRADYFMENLDAFIPMIKNQSIIKSCLNSDLPIHMVATRDIGWKAADFLDSTAPLGHMVFAFGGPHAVSMNHVADVFSSAFGEPGLRYQKISYEEAKQNMLASGMPGELVDLMIEMYEGFNSGLIKPSQELKPSHCGTTSVEEYILMIAHKIMAFVKR